MWGNDMAISFFFTEKDIPAHDFLTFIKSDIEKWKIWQISSDKWQQLIICAINHKDLRQIRNQRKILHLFVRDKLVWDTLLTNSNIDQQLIDVRSTAADPSKGIVDIDIVNLFFI